MRTLLKRFPDYIYKSISPCRKKFSLDKSGGNLFDEKSTDFTAQGNTFLIKGTSKNRLKIRVFSL